ncbi:kinase-like protein [Rhizophagus irregularis]|uniref:Kinase-like protein n=1 Tax=Rhizophagus irregularis TaxID=588596 RepID=A0A2I1EZG1_9GLOM|nr:kinase-like protein [Rhizophagus irregularis]PKY27514.1 kinase-like protein [Rhizophagus irregularis]
MAHSNDKVVSSSTKESGVIFINGNKSSGLFKPAVKSLDDRDDGTHGRSRNVDTFILESNLKWIPYDKFKNVEFLYEVRFAITYKAIWSLKSGDKEVILKSSNSNLDEHLINELIYHANCLESTEIINLYGYTKKPDTLNYMAVMEYAINSNFAKVIEMNWKQRLCILYKIISGLCEIHNQNLIHCLLCDAYILIHEGEEDKENNFFIGGFELCQPVKSFLKRDDNYGVLQFMAPEVLRGKPHTSASDIYSFSIIMWEFTSGVLPFNDREYDFQLNLSICEGERPEIIENTPQCYTDLMKRCWNEDPLKRPSASEVRGIIGSWIFHYSDNINDELKSNIMEFKNEPVGSHPQTFSSKVVDETLESEDSEASYYTILGSENLDDFIKTDEN